MYHGTKCLVQFQYKNRFFFILVGICGQRFATFGDIGDNGITRILSSYFICFGTPRNFFPPVFQIKKAEWSKPFRGVPVEGSSKSEGVGSIFQLGGVEVLGGEEAYVGVLRGVREGTRRGGERGERERREKGKEKRGKEIGGRREARRGTKVDKRRRNKKRGRGKKEGEGGNQREDLEGGRGGRSGVPTILY
jgi:hypothetical protein